MATPRGTTSARARTAPKGRPTPARPRKPTRRASGEFLDYDGEQYELATKIGVWPLMQLARAAQEGVASTDIRGLAALHAMFQDIIYEGDWPRFEAHMIAAKMSDPMGLLQTTQDAVARIQERQAKSRLTPVQGQIESA